MKNCLHVCGLRDVARTAKEIGASHIVSVIEVRFFPTTPKGIQPTNHLRLDMDDIVLAHPDYVLPSEKHVLDLLAFVESWCQTSPILIHCYAGMSRSTACAFITACALNPASDEARIATAIKAISQTATPNRRLVALADDILDRKGRMVAAVAEMNESFVDIARPFSFGLDDFKLAA